MRSRGLDLCPACVECIFDHSWWRDTISRLYVRYSVDSFYVGKNCERLPSGGVALGWETRGRWFAVRHGGNDTDYWRLLAVSDTADRPRREFSRAVDRMRRGAAALVDADGVVRGYASAPGPGGGA